MRCGACTILLKKLVNALHCTAEHLVDCCDAYWKSLEPASRDILLAFLKSSRGIGHLGVEYNQFIESDTKDESLILISLLSKFQDRQASDPRDNVYGSLGLCPSEIREKVLADYNASLANSYALPLICDFENARSLRALRMVVFSASEEGQRLLLWVLDWSTGSDAWHGQSVVFESYHLYNAANCAQILFERRWDRLPLTGHHRESVRYVGVASSSTPFNEILEDMKGWFDLCVLPTIL